MTKEEIREGNELIAKFMGGKFTLINSHTPNVEFKNHPRQDRNFNNTRNTHLHPKCFAYHKSWDWLIPVCEKISNNEYVRCATYHLPPNPIFSIQIKESYGGKYFISEEKHYISPIMTVYCQVIEFIKWYNDNKK